MIGLFLSISSYLTLLGINFIGLSYILVYVGAVSILFIFILMLINIRVSELVNESSNSIPLAIFIVVFFYYPMQLVLPNSAIGFKYYDLDHNIYKYNILINKNNLWNEILYLSFYKEKIIFVTSGLWDGNLAESYHITSIGNIMYTNYSIWLIITSMILLLAMVGTICLVISDKNK